MNGLYKRAVRNLLDRGLTIDPIVDFPDLQRLDALARAADEFDFDWSTQLAFETRATAGNVTLFRLSIGAADFYDRHVAPYLDPDDRASEVTALAWCMAHANDPRRLLLPFANRPEALGAHLTDWRAGLGCTWEELDRAVARLLMRRYGNADLARLCPSAPVPVDADNGGSRIAASLAKHFGNTPDFWYWEAPDSLVDEMLNALDADRAAENAGSDRTINPAARWVRARKALRLLTEEIAAKIAKRAEVPTTGKGAP